MLTQKLIGVIFLSVLKMGITIIQIVLPITLKTFKSLQLQIGQRIGKNPLFLFRMNSCRISMTAVSTICVFPRPAGRFRQGSLLPTGREDFLDLTNTMRHPDCFPVVILMRSAASANSAKIHFTGRWNATLVEKYPAPAIRGSRWKTVWKVRRPAPGAIIISTWGQFQLRSGNISTGHMI